MTLRSRARLRWLALLFAALGLSASQGCARNPVTGWPEFVLVSTSGEVEIGRQEAEKVEKAIGYVPDRPLQLWVQEIGKRLAAHSPRQDIEYRFYVVDMVEPNAFALPGGHVYVSRGLLALVNSEDELACVLGHEIGHAAARHAVQRATITTPFALVLGIPTAIVGTVSDILGGVLGGVSSLAAGVVVAPYSRRQERHADRLGLELAAAAGWDPAAMSGFLHTLEREQERTAGKARRFHFFDSHPTTPSRVRDTAEYAEKLEPVPRDAIAADRTALLARLDGLLIGENPTQGVFDDELFMHPVLGFGIRFPEGWRTDNARDYVAASEPDDPAVLVVLQLAAEGYDPIQGAQADGLDEGATERLETVEIDGLRAVRFEGERRGSGFELTWVAHRGHIYRIVASAPRREFARWRATLQGVARSFHPLDPAERERILESRLRVARAREGESLGALIERTGSSWSIDEAAVANGLEAGEPLPQGAQLKLPVPERFQAS